MRCFGALVAVVLRAKGLGDGGGVGGGAWIGVVVGFEVGGGEEALSVDVGIEAEEVKGWEGEEGEIGHGC